MDIIMKVLEFSFQGFWRFIGMLIFLFFIAIGLSSIRLFSIVHHNNYYNYKKGEKDEE